MIKRQNRWQLQEAKNKLSEVVRRAQTEGPQTITVRGEDAVVVLSWSEYRENLGAIEGDEPPETLGAFLMRSPLRGSELELARDDDLGRDVALPAL